MDNESGENGPKGSNSSVAEVPQRRKLISEEMAEGMLAALESGANMTHESEKAAAWATVQPVGKRRTALERRKV